MSTNRQPRLARGQRVFNDHGKSRSRRGDEAVVLFALISTSSRRRLPFLNRPWPRWFAVTLTVLSFAVRVSSRAAEHQDSLDKAFRLVLEAVEKDEVPGAIALVARGG